MKKWIKAVIIGILVLLGLFAYYIIYLFFTTGMKTTIEYGAPHYRPQVE